MATRHVDPAQQAFAAMRGALYTGDGPAAVARSCLADQGYRAAVPNMPRRP